MSSQDWYVLIADASFFLLGIAISPLAWLARHREKSEREEDINRRLHQHSKDLKTLHARIDHLETSLRAENRGADDAARVHSARVRRDSAVNVPRNSFDPGSSVPSPIEPPTLIAIPKLASSGQDSDNNNLDALSERYAAIWNLADTGSPPEVIARVTGQPIGQVELILGLRRQLAGPHSRAARPNHA